MCFPTARTPCKTASETQAGKRHSTSSHLIPSPTSPTLHCWHMFPFLLSGSQACEPGSSIGFEALTPKARRKGAADSLSSCIVCRRVFCRNSQQQQRSTQLWRPGPLIMAAQHPKGKPHFFNKRHSRCGVCCLAPMCSSTARSMGASGQSRLKRLCFTLAWSGSLAQDGLADHLPIAQQAWNDVSVIHRAYDCAERVELLRGNRHCNHEPSRIEF